MATGDYKLIKMNSSSSFDEKTVQAESGNILGFDSELNPKSIDLLSNTTEPLTTNLTIGTEWYCNQTDRTYTWLGAWIDLHRTF